MADGQGGAVVAGLAQQAAEVEADLLRVAVAVQKYIAAQVGNVVFAGDLLRHAGLGGVAVHEIEIIVLVQCLH